MTVEIPPMDDFEESEGFTAQDARDAFNAATEDQQRKEDNRELARQLLEAHKAVVQDDPPIKRTHALAKVAASIEHERRTYLDPNAEAYEGRRVSLASIQNMKIRKRNQRWFVEGVIPSTGIFIVFGNSGSCKSWSLLDGCLRSLCSIPGNFMGIEGARIHPLARILWIYGHEDLGSDAVDENTGKSIDLPHARTQEMLSREADPLEIDIGSSIEFCFARGRDELRAIIQHALAGDTPPQVIVIDTITSVVPATLDMKNSEVAEFYGDLKQDITDHDTVLIPVGHPRKQGTDTKGARDPLHKDNLLGGGAISGVIAGSLGIHAERPEDVLPEGTGIRVKLTKRNKTSTSEFTEVRVHWDADEHIFLQGEKPSDLRAAERDDERLSYLRAARSAAIRSGLADEDPISVNDIRPVDGEKTDDGTPIWPSNTTRARKDLAACGWVVVTKGPGGRATHITITDAGMRELSRSL